MPTPEVLAPFAGPVADDRGTFSTRKLRLPRRRRHVVDGRTAKTSFRWPRTSGMDVEPPRDAIDAPCHYVPLNNNKSRSSHPVIPRIIVIQTKDHRDGRAVI